MSSFEGIHQDFLVFGEDFNRHPHALEHLLTPLFASSRFIWVETIGMRSPKFSLYDFKRILEKIRNMLFAKKRVKDQTGTHYKNVHVVSPFMIPYAQYKLIRFFNILSVKRAVKKKMNELGFKHFTFITSVPQACDFVKIFGESKSIYYCVDEFALWPGLNFSLVREMEELLLGKVDYLFATAEHLVSSRKREFNGPILLTHGVFFDHFNIGPLKKDPNSLFELTYFGLFDERSNQHLLEGIVNQYPDLIINIIGDVVVDVSRLKHYSQIKFWGKVAYNDLPKAISNTNIFILPYHINDMTLNINPLKLKEYMATGRFVVATALPEVVKLSDYVCVAQSESEFIQLVGQIKRNELLLDHQKVVEYVKNYETWQAKLINFLEGCELITHQL